MHLLRFISRSQIFNSSLPYTLPHMPSESPQTVVYGQTGDLQPCFIIVFLLICAAQCVYSFWFLLPILNLELNRNPQYSRMGLLAVLEKSHFSPSSCTSFSQEGFISSNFSKLYAKCIILFELRVSVLFI